MSVLCGVGRERDVTMLVLCDVERERDVTMLVLCDVGLGESQS